VRARSEGRREIDTKQPNREKSAEGGLRFGEMEADCTKAHGAAMVFVDRHCYSSDARITYECTRCHASIFDNKKLKKTFCQQCKAWKTGLSLTIPAGTTCFHEELATIGFKITVEGARSKASSNNFVYSVG
jgi:DNA-directed RNA polymerase II subunit RPB2